MARYVNLPRDEIKALADHVAATRAVVDKEREALHAKLTIIEQAEARREVRSSEAFSAKAAARRAALESVSRTLYPKWAAEQERKAQERVKQGDSAARHLLSRELLSLLETWPDEASQMCADIEYAMQPDQLIARANFLPPITDATSEAADLRRIAEHFERDRYRDYLRGGVTDIESEVRRIEREARDAADQTPALAKLAEARAYGATLRGDVRGKSTAAVAGATARIFFTTVVTSSGARETQWGTWAGYRAVAEDFNAAEQGVFEIAHALQDMRGADDRNVQAPAGAVIGAEAIH